MARSRPLARWGFAALLCLGVLDSPPSASAAVTLVRQYINSGNPVSQITAPSSGTFPSNTAVGNTLIMVGANWSCSLSSVTGGGVTTWNKATSSNNNSNIEIWYGVVDVATTTGVTAVLNTSAPCISPNGGQWMNLSEWSGLTGSLDQTSAGVSIASSASGNGSSATTSAGSITTQSANALVIFGVTDAVSTGTLSAPWNPMTAIAAPDKQSSWYQVVASSGTVVNPAPTAGDTTWEAAIAAFDSCTVADASYVAANGQNNLTNVYWGYTTASTASRQVIIVRNTTNTFTAPTNGVQYAVNSTIGSDKVMYVGVAGQFTQTTADAQNPILNNTVYYYKVYTNCALSYSTGVVVSIKPSTAPPLWSYATTAATLAPPGIDDNNVVVWGGNDNKVHGADATLGTLRFPVFTQPGGALQSRPTIIPLAYSQTGVNVAYVSSQDGYVYAVNTSTGAAVWSNPTACSGTGTRSCVPGSNNLQGGAAVWLQAIQQLQICGVNVDAVFVGTRISGNNTGNSVYALNGSASPVVSGGGGNCRASGTTVQPGDYLWKFTGASGGTPNLAPITSTPYVDYNNNVVWVTSNAANGLAQPSLWKLNVQNGMLANGTTACGSGASQSCWSLGHTDSSPTPSSDGTWIYVGTNCIPAGCATQAATLNAVPVGGGTVQTYNPGTTGFNGTGNIKNPYPMLSTSFGTQSAGITYVNSKTQASSGTSCAVDMGTGASPSNGLTAGNTVIILVTYPITSLKTVNITDNRGSIYSRRRTIGASNLYGELWSGTIVPGAGTIITASFGATSTTSLCAVAQYSGVGAINNAATGTFQNTTSGTNASVGPSTATVDTNNRVVTVFAYANNSAFTAGTGTLRTSGTTTGLGGAIVDQGTTGGAKATVTNSVTHATGLWVGGSVELRSVTVDQIVYTRDSSPHGIQFAGSLSTTVTTTFNPTWQSCCGSLSISGPVDDGQGRLYFGLATGKLLQYDAWSGFNGVWNDFTLHSAPQIAPGTTTILGDPSYDGVLNRLYFGGNDGRVYAITPGW